MSEIILDVPVLLDIAITAKCGSDVEFTFEESPDSSTINISINDYLFCNEEEEMIQILSAKGYYIPEHVSELSTREIKPLHTMVGQLHTLSQEELRTLVIAAIDELAKEEPIPF